MRNHIYKKAQAFLNSYSLEILRELPNRFSLDEFAAKAHLVFPDRYAETIRDFSGEKYLKFWINTYYFPRKISIVKRCGSTSYDGFRIDFTQKSPLDRVWLKVTK